MSEKDWTRLDKSVQARPLTLGDAFRAAGLVWNDSKQCWVGNGIELYAKRVEVIPIWDHRHPHFIDHILGNDNK